MDPSKIQAIRKKLSLNCGGRLITLEKPAVMGILNLTPDSFYEPSRPGADGLLQRVETLLAEGALFIDAGGYSTRPGAGEVSEQEEADRVIPAIELIHRHYPDALVSVDTFRARIAELAVNAGAALINDISSGDDDQEMMSTVARLNVPYIMMHKKGTPKTMNSLAHYENIVLEVLEYFNARISEAKKHGISDLILDPGFGFAKNLEHNYTLLRQLNDLQVTGLPVLAGISRKKMIQSVTGTNAAGALNGTTVAHTVALLNGANLLRVHDVKEAVECIQMISTVYGNF